MKEGIILKNIALFVNRDRDTDLSATKEVIALLKKYAPLWVIPHINHPVEISEKWSEKSYNLLKKLVDNGIPIQSQTVLLRGINDDVNTLATLFEKPC